MTRAVRAARALAVLLSLAAASLLAAAEEGAGDGYDEVIALADYMVQPQFNAMLAPTLSEYVGFRSVSAMDATYRNETRACAEWLRDYVRKHLDMFDAKLYESGHRNPIVVGTSDKDAPEKPNVVIYGHYDVQPVDPVDLWDSDPFSLKRLNYGGEYGAVYYGRGASDNKGASWSAISALAMMNRILKNGLRSLPYNIILVVEGEEEIGSPGFKRFLEEHKDTIFRNTEFVVSADGCQKYRDRGSMVLSLRGTMGVQVDVKGANSDLHSGTYGGSILNPIVALTRVLSSVFDPETNKVLLDGYYDGVVELTPDEALELEEAIGVDDAAEAQRLGVGKMFGEAGYTTAQRRTVRPTAELVGIYGGFREEGIKTVLPSEAHAKFVFRLAPGQDPQQIWDALVAHVDAVAPTLARGVKVSLQRLNDGAPAYIADRQGTGFRVAAEVLDEVYAKPHTITREGGTINAVTFFKEIAGLDTIVLAFSDTDDFVHAPNERFRLESLTNGQKAYARLILKLAREFGDAHAFRITGSPTIERIRAAMGGQEQAFEGQLQAGADLASAEL